MIIYVNIKHILSGYFVNLKNNQEQDCTFNSFASMVPDPSESNKSKASLISCFCSSVSSGLGPTIFNGYTL